MFSIIPKKTVSVADIKKYLVDEFNKNNDQQKEIDDLKDKIKKSLETELKYQTTLVTLDEYKKRLDNKDSRITKLEKDIEGLENKLRKENNLKNDEILKYKKLESLYDELKHSFNKKVDEKFNTEKSKLLKIDEYLKYKNKIDNIIKEIENQKGNISKKTIIEIIKNN